VAGFDAGWEIDLFGKNRRALEAAKYESAMRRALSKHAGSA
jgi:outer membrane protein TolC